MLNIHICTVTSERKHFSFATRCSPFYIKELIPDNIRYHVLTLKVEKGQTIYSYCQKSHHFQREKKVHGLTILGSGFLLFLRVTYEAMEDDSGTGDLVLGGTMPTG